MQSNGEHASLMDAVKSLIKQSCESSLTSSNPPHVKDSPLRDLRDLDRLAEITDSLERGDATTARKLSFCLLKDDGMHFDGYMAILLYLQNVVDADTSICAYCELMAAMRLFLPAAFEQNIGHFYAAAATRPYIRALVEMASAARTAGRLGLATTIYEELIRLNHDDSTGARSPLVACYLQLIGRRKRVPSTQPFRTLAHLRALLAAEFDGQKLFRPRDDLEPMKRWAEIFIAWESRCEVGDEWKTLAKAEYQISPLFIRALLDGCDLTPVGVAGIQVECNPGDSADMARVYGPWIRDAISDWPDFFIELHNFFRPRDDKFNGKVHRLAPDPTRYAQEKAVNALRALAGRSLQAGRDDIAGDRFSETLIHCGKARQAWSLINFETGKWHVGAEFAIASNRAYGAARLGHWALARIDSRFTLAMRPNHRRTYERIDRIIKAHFCPQLESRINDLLGKVSAVQDEASAEWNSLAQSGIALLSLSTIVAARTGRLTDEFISERMQLGIEDMYQPVSLADELHPVLPWLQESDGARSQ